MKISKYSGILLVVLSIIFVQCSNDSFFEPANTSSVSDSDLSLQKHGRDKGKDHKNAGIKVYHTSKTIVVDGKDRDWKKAPKYKMGNYFDLTGPIGKKFNKYDLSASFQMLWDDENLYIFVTILDDVINADAVEPYDNDSFEFFIDSDNSKNPPIDENIPHDYPGSYDANDEQIRFIWQQAPVRHPWLYDISQIEYAYHETKKGWNLEIKIPFETLVDFPVATGHVFGVEFHVNDNDGAGRENYLKWNSESDFTYLYPSLFGTAYLSQNKAK